jgi:hypothetical protein
MVSMTRQVKSVFAAVEELGGPQAVADLFGVTENAVYNWIRRGFPPETWIVLRHALARKGVRARDCWWPRMRQPKGSAMAAE